MWLNKIRRKEIKANAKANKRCVQCKLDGKPDSFTKWVCLGCGYIYLCNAKTKRKGNQDCFAKYHQSQKIHILQGQRELAHQLGLVD